MATKKNDDEKIVTHTLPSGTKVHAKQSVIDVLKGQAGGGSPAAK